MNDIGHGETDKLIESLERRLAHEYAVAANEMQAKLDAYMLRFAKKDELWQAMVEAGRKTEQQYRQWQIGQIMIGQRWEEMRDSLAADMHNVNAIARSIVDGYTPEAYALNHNYATFMVEKQSALNTSYTLYDRQSVERLIRDDPELLPPPSASLSAELAAQKDIAWQKGQIQSITTQSILQGESIPNMAKRISSTISTRNYASSVRYARTAMTAAENAGRQDAYDRASKMGIPLKRQWIATLDGRTRYEHRQLDGQVRGLDEPFEVDGEEIDYPGDPSAPAHLVWNCRCRTISVIENFEIDVSDLSLRHNDHLIDMSYEEWKQDKRKGG